MKRLILCLVFLCVFWGCKKPQNPNSEKPPVADQNSGLSQLQVCTELHPEVKDDGKIGIKATLLKDRLWWHDVRFQMGLTVRFLNGTDFQKNKVMQYAKEWNAASAKGRENKRKINIRFIPYDGTSSGNVADIRVMFQDGGSSSYIGTAAKAIAQDQPTMFFGWVKEGQTEEVLRAVILHEFGHALGLVHEHQSPVANIPWDKEKVYQYYAATQRPPWTRDQVDKFVFERYSEEQTNHTAYDATSIMHYAISDELTIGDYSTPWNTVLSPSDLSFIKAIYPYRPCVINEDCCFDRRTGREIRCP